MKKRWKKLAALLLSCLLLIPMLAACGGNGDSSNPGGASGNPEDRTLVRLPHLFPPTGRILP